MEIKATINGTDTILIPVMSGQRARQVRQENELGYETSAMYFGQRELDEGGFLKVSEYSQEAADAFAAAGIDENNIVAMFEIF